MVNMYFLGFACSFLLVLLQIPFVIKLSIRYGWYDERDVYRKDHQKGISRLGGVALFLGFMFSVMIGQQVENASIFLLVPGYLVMFGLGLKDDLHGVPVGIKAGGQTIAALLVLHFGQFNTGSLYDFLQMGQGYGYLSCLIVTLLILIVSNSFNMIDGIDGLAGVIGLFVHLMLGLLLWIAGAADYTLCAIVMAGAIAGFLYYNINPARIFMGDCGSMLIGLSAAVLSIVYLNHCLLHAKNTASFRAPGIITALLIVPVFDLFRIFTLRLLGRKSPFTGDRNHLHHQLKHLGLSDNEAVLLLLAFNMTVFLFTFFLNQFGNLFMMVMQCGLCLIFHGLLIFLKSFK